MPALRRTARFLEVASVDWPTRSASSLTISCSPLASSRRRYQRMGLLIAPRMSASGMVAEGIGGPFWGSDMDLVCLNRPIRGKHEVRRSEVRDQRSEDG